MHIIIITEAALHFSINILLYAIIHIVHFKAMNKKKKLGTHFITKTI